MMTDKANRFCPSRRRFLLATSAVAMPMLAAQAGGDEAVLLRPHTKTNLVRVRIELEVEGNVDVPKNSLVSRQSDLKLPITSAATFDYEERYQRPAGADVNSEVTVAERYYHVAKSQSQLNHNEQSCELRDSVRQTIVRREVMPEVIYSVDDYFHRDELELLRLPVSSLGADRLLPIEAVRVGSEYAPSKEALVSVLNLSSVEATDVTAEVVAVTDTDAKIHFRGKVDGSVEGVPTVIRTIGKLIFDRKAGAITWLAVAIHESREVGKAEPGFDVAATIKMLRKPLDKTIALSPTPAKLKRGDSIPEDRLYVDLQSHEVGLHAMMDRRWRMMTDVPGAAMMRMTENDRSIAQCDFRPLASLDPGQQWSLEAFEQDVRRTLGEQLIDLVESDERHGHAGLRVLRVTASGAAEGVPIQWVVLHFSDDSGRRLLATFTMESSNAEVFAGSDMQLVGSLQFAELNQKASSAVARNGANGDRVRIANSKSGNKSIDEVQSASDLK